MRPRLLPVLALLLTLLAGCGANPVREGRELISAGRVDEGIAHLEKAMRDKPEDREIRAAYYRQRELAIAPLIANADADRAAGRLDSAEARYRQVLTLDPNHPRGQGGLDEVAAQRRHAVRLAEAEARHKSGDLAGAELAARAILAESTGHAGARALLLSIRQARQAAEAPPAALKSALAKPITLEFRDAPLKSVFEFIARTAGVNFAFDKDVKGDAKVTLFIRNAAIEDAVRMLLLTQQLERKVLNENSLLIYPNTSAKAKEHLEFVTRSFYLANADPKQAQALIKTVAKIRDVYVDERLNLIVIKDTPDAVRLAEQLVASIDIAEPEVMLDVEVLELSRSRLLDLGLRFPDQVGYGRLDGSANVAGGVIDLRDRSGLTSYVANPGLLLNLRHEDGSSNLLANPRIRVRNRDKAKIHIGEKLPVFTTTSTANVGVSASVSYLDVGLKLDVEPNVYLDDEVAIKVALEVSSIVKEISGPAASLAYQVGTRTAATSLRLRNGETQILAGLISDEERSSANRLPGLGDIPLLGRLFSSQRDTANKTEIVLLITPRVVRNLERPETAGPTLPAGTESAVGAPPARLSATRPGQIGMAPGSGARPTAGAEAAEAVAAEAAAQAAQASQAAATGTAEASPVSPAPPVESAPAIAPATAPVAAPDKAPEAAAR